MRRQSAWVRPFLFVLLLLLLSTLACGRRGRATPMVWRATATRAAAQEQMRTDQQPTGEQPSPILEATQVPQAEAPSPEEPSAEQPQSDALPAIDYFYSESSPNAGCYLLHWDLHGATAAYLDGQGVAAPGSDELCPGSGDYTHVLRAENRFGSVEESVSVSVAGSAAVEAPPVQQVIPLQNLQTRLQGESVLVTWVDGSEEASYILMMGQESVGLDADTNSYLWPNPPCEQSVAIVLIARDASGAELSRLQTQVETAPCPALSETTTLQSSPAEDGFIRGLTEGENVVVQGEIKVGDGKQNRQWQAFFSFDLGSIPQGATIQQAVLDLSNHQLIGDPFAADGLGQLAYYTLSYGELGLEDFVPGPLPQGYYLFEREPRTVDVRDMVHWLRNQQGADRFQCRLQFAGSTNNNDFADGLSFPEGGPSLTITFVP